MCSFASVSIEAPALVGRADFPTSGARRLRSGEFALIIGLCLPCGLLSPATLRRGVTACRDTTTAAPKAIATRRRSRLVPRPSIPAKSVVRWRSGSSPSPRSRSRAAASTSPTRGSRAATPTDRAVPRRTRRRTTPRRRTTAPRLAIPLRRARRRRRPRRARRPRATARTAAACAPSSSAFPRRASRSRVRRSARSGRACSPTSASVPRTASPRSSGWRLVDAVNDGPVTMILDTEAEHAADLRGRGRPLRSLAGRRGRRGPRRLAVHALCRHATRAAAVVHRGGAARDRRAARRTARGSTSPRWSRGRHRPVRRAHARGRSQRRAGDDDPRYRRSRSPPTRLTAPTARGAGIEAGRRRARSGPDPGSAARSCVCHA